MPPFEGHGMVYQLAAFLVKILSASQPPDVPSIISDRHMAEVKTIFIYLLAHLCDIVRRRPAQDRKGRDMACGYCVF
jgi:hypothetical protein